MSAEDRFWAKVDRSGGPDACWPWTGHMTEKGYGRVRFAGARTRAHRVAYELTRGAIGDGLQLDHLCRNRACVNPDHLEPVTGKENTLRGVSMVARNAVKERCVHGHPFDEENTYTRPDGSRACRTCARQHLARHREQRQRARA